MLLLLLQLLLMLVMLLIAALPPWEMVVRHWLRLRPAILRRGGHPRRLENDRLYVHGLLVVMIVLVM